MATNDSTHIFLAIFMSILAFASTIVAVSPVAGGGCSDEVVAFSPCLDYISSPPNNVSISPSDHCCDVFASAFEIGLADCLCYLLRQPLFLGFPLNSTRLLSLSSLCPLKMTESKKNSSLDTVCAGLLALPPLRAMTGPDKSSPPSISLPPESADNSPTLPSPPLLPARNSWAAKEMNTSSWGLLGMMIYLVLLVIFSYI